MTPIQRGSRVETSRMTSGLHYDTASFDLYVTGFKITLKTLALKCRSFTQPKPLFPSSSPPPLLDAYEPTRYLQPPSWRLQLPKVDIFLSMVSFIHFSVYRLQHYM